jgi:uncharacterized protein with FMN-binding domain
LQNSNNPYTTTRIKSSRPWVTSTVAIAVLAIGGGVAVDSYLNPSHAAPTSSASNPTPTATGKPDMTVSGDAIQYRYGVVQVEVVRTAGKISAVNLVQGTASAGRDQAFSYLQQYAVDSQGSSFANLSGATYTTDAFKQALDSAISKLS